MDCLFEGGECAAEWHGQLYIHIIVRKERERERELSTVRNIVEISINNNNQ